MYDFDLARPRTIAEAVEALAEEDALALAGGQTLIPTLKARLAMPSTLVSLSGVEELRGLKSFQGTLVIGAGTSHAEIANGARDSYPALARLASHVGDAAVRNRGTIGGSVANNDPSACYPAAVLGSNATVVTNAREIAAEDYFQGMFDTALDEGEIITSLRFPVPLAAHYEKFEQPASRFALVGVFVAKFESGVRVAVTGASENGVFRWSEAEDALGKDFSADVFQTLDISSEDMISDAHGGAEYRAHLVKVVAARAVAAAI